MSDEGSKELVRRAPDQLVGRTWADLIAHSQTGPRLDAALARMTDWTVERVGLGVARLRGFLNRVDRKLEQAAIEPRAIPERVVLDIAAKVAREERDELHDLWAELMVSASAGMSIDAFHIDLVNRLDPVSVAVFGYCAVGGANTHLVIELAGRIFGYESAEMNYQRQREVEVGLARCYALGILTPPPLDAGPDPYSSAYAPHARSRAATSLDTTNMITPIGRHLIEVLNSSGEFYSRYAG